MSLERMRWLLNIDSVPDVIETHGRQQLHPDMRFTCNGVITKWIIGAERLEDGMLIRFPELQVWRQANNSTTYQKVNGTVISVLRVKRGGNDIVEYELPQPISVESGDILGVFEPQSSEGRPNRMVLLSETITSQTVHYVPIENSETSPYDVIGLNGNEISEEHYQPLISVEFGKYKFILLLQLT